MVSPPICSLRLLTASSTVLFCDVYIPSAVCVLSPLPPTIKPFFPSVLSLTFIAGESCFEVAELNMWFRCRGSVLECCDELQFSGQQSFGSPDRTRLFGVLVCHLGIISFSLGKHVLQHIFPSINKIFFPVV